MYENTIIHRDLKLENIAKAGGIWKIIDFGFSKMIEERDAVRFGSNIGTPETIAPEVRNGEIYGAKVLFTSLRRTSTRWGLFS